jgi:hypothetical protein
MIRKFKEIKRNITIFIAQSLANIIYKRMQLCIDLEDYDIFDMLYEQSAWLNAYCVKFHNIYLH